MIQFKSNIIFYFAYILLVINLIQCSDKKITEIEPNNSFTFANILEQGSIFTGYIDTKDDKDYYKLLIEEETILDISLSGIKGINLSIALWKDSNTPEMLKLIDDGRKSSAERMSNAYVSPGSYYISIQHGDRDRKKGDTKIPYELTIEQRAPVNEEKEPNDTLLTANQLQVNDEITGFYSPSFNKLNLNKDTPLREEDWFSFETNENETYPLALNVLLSGVNDINAELLVLNSSGEKIAYADKAATGFGEELKNVGIGEPGIYYICITSKGYKSNPDLPYTLDVQLTDIDKNLELENNDSFPRANYIVNDSISGSIEDSSDKDLFYYQYAQGDFFRIELIPLENCDLKFIIFDLNKNILFDINNNNQGEPEIFSNFFTNESFYIGIQNNDALNNSNCPYNCIISPIIIEHDIEREPNNDKSTASTVSDESIVGFSSYLNDVDYYIIKTPIRTKKSFEIVGSKEGTCTFSITDPLGYIIKTRTVNSEESVVITEMIDKKGFIIIEHNKYDYKNPYILTIKDAK